MSTLLKVNAIHSGYDNHPILNGLSFTLKTGDLVGLVGPSGCGKTTALRCIAGFQPITNGNIILDDTNVSYKGFTKPPEQRHLGMVFQDYALFPHLNIRDNITFGISKKTAQQQQDISDKMLVAVGLENYANRYPHELSGGQQQRVALARALAPEPNILLLDEPFSNLDPELREALALEVRKILKTVNTTAILVTHDQNEAFAICDHIGVMNQGKIEQWDTPYNLYHAPGSRFIAEFIGRGRFISGRIIDDNNIDTAFGVLHTEHGHNNKIGQKLDILIRPDDIQFKEDSELKGTVINHAFKGADMLYTLEMPQGAHLTSLLPSEFQFQIGDTIPICISAERMVSFVANQ